MSTSTGQADLSALRINHDQRDNGSSGNGKTTKYLVIAATGAILLFVGYYFFRGGLAATPEVEVTTASLTSPSSANAVLTASGYVVAQQKAAIASKATGRLVFLGVEEGDKVKLNQIIARIEDTDVAAALMQSRANLELSKADFDDANQWLDRTRTMFTSGTMSKSELDGAEARFKRIEASIKSAEANVRASEVALENTRIRAPFDGTVLTKNANVGEVVAPFAAGASSRAAVVTIADMSSLEVEADVSESNITRVTPGGPCEITLDAYPEARYQGFVHKIVPTADRAKATVLTKVRFKERDERVLPEMSAKVTFLSKALDAAEAKQTPKLTVPSTSVVARDGKDVVLLVRDETILEATVRIGGRIGERSIIEEGIAQGDKIILRPDPTLTSGTKVKVKQ
jgi:RND family efflux transporter MFP subunit